MTALIATGVLFLMTLLSELKNIGEGDYGFSEAIIYVLMRMPAEVYQFAPMLILLGCIAGLSILSTYRELAVMRSSGFSIRQIISSVLGAAFFLTIVIGFVGEGLAPKLSHTAEISKENEKNAGQAVVTGTGVWLHVDNNFIHVEQVVGQQLLEGVTRYQFDDKHHLEVAYYAKSLTYQNNQWFMNDGVKTTFYKDRTRSQSFQQGKWDLKFNSNLLNIGLVDPAQMSLPKLAKFANYLEQNGLRASEYRYEFWQRVLQPLAALIMVFLAIPFVLGTLNVSTLGFRMLIGIMMGFAFFISNAFLGQICIVYQIPALLAAFLPLALFALLGIFLSRRLIRY
jgi:lipopolysaccharide export system permease protein